MGKGKSGWGDYQYGLGFFSYENCKLKQAYPEVNWIPVHPRLLDAVWSTTTHNPKANPQITSLRNHSPSSHEEKLDALIRGCIVYSTALSGNCEAVLIISNGSPRDAIRAARSLGLESMCNGSASKLNPKIRIF